MSRLTIRVPHLLLITLVSLLALPGATLAAAPTFRDKIDFTVDPNEICGVEGVSHVTGIQVGFEEQGAFMVTGQVQETFTASDGRTVQFRVAGSYRNSYTENSDGTVTIVDTWVGRPESISGAHGRPVSQDVGLITFTTVLDAETGDLISQDVVIHGPHPEADADFNLFCEAFLEALG